MPRQTTTKAKYWLATIPHHIWVPHLNENVSYCKGQLEIGESTQYLHWQIFFITTTQCRVSSLKKSFGDECHFEATRSAAGEAYVWKEATKVVGTEFELGNRPFKRNSPEDWDRIMDCAKRGNWNGIPAELQFKHFRNIQAISAQNATPTGLTRTVHVYWGRTGAGKSKKAWEEASLDAYPKDPCTKFWDGYRGHEHVVIDEFRGTISISHLLRWFDRYPVLVEIKGSSVVFKAKTIWITSNLHPRDWYKDLDEETLNALLRRLTITHFQ